MKKLKGLFLNLSFSKHLPQILLTAAFITVLGLFYSLTGSKSNFVWIITLIIYAAAIIIVDRLSSGTMSDNDDFILTSLVEGATLDFILKTPNPVLICSSKEDIAWVNNSFSLNHEKKAVIGKPFDEVFDFSLSNLCTKKRDEGTSILLDGFSYNVRCYPFTVKEKKRYLVVCEDKSELEKSKQSLADEDTQVALIFADNLEELAQYTKESTRDAAVEVEALIREWVSESGGILKEYQNGRYIFLFRAAEMPAFIENKFDILDKIHRVRVGESSFSITVSMGIAQISGTLAEKERVASEALDMALQRGGNQVVVKSTKGMEFYGGKNQSVQKRTKVRARVIASELVALISQSSNVIIMGHKNPDFDCIGACIGIARIASFCGVPFCIVANKNDPTFSKCFDRISSIPDYSEHTVIDSNEAQDLIGSDTLTVIVDVNNKLQLEAPHIAEISHKTVYIDHHRKTAEFDEPPVLSYIEPSASSACELVAELLEQATPSGKLSKEEADIMYSGILLDTKQFTRNTGVRTFSAALYLRDEGANPSDAQTLFKSDLSDFISEAKFESNVVLYRKIIAISCNDSPDNTQADRISAAKAADKLLTVDGVKASFALCRIEDKIHISARSTGDINVQLILEKLNGGGHFDSAATQIQGEMTEALICLRRAIDEYISEIILTERN